MGGCCSGRNAHEAILDDFFNHMKLTEENTKDVLALLENEIDKEGNFYKGLVEKFVKNFCENHLNKDNEKVNNEAKKYFEHLYNSSLKQKNFFQLSSLIILLSKCEDNKIEEYAESLLILAGKFKIELKNEKEISRLTIESLIEYYILSVSTNVVIFVKVFSNNPHEFSNTYTKTFNEENVMNLKKELMNGWEKEYINLSDFLRSNYCRLNHSQVRQYLIDNSKTK